MIGQSSYGSNHFVANTAIWLVDQYRILDCKLKFLKIFWRKTRSNFSNGPLQCLGGKHIFFKFRTKVRISWWYWLEGARDRQDFSRDFGHQVTYWLKVRVTVFQIIWTRNRPCKAWILIRSCQCSRANAAGVDEIDSNGADWFYSIPCILFQSLDYSFW